MSKPAPFDPKKSAQSLAAKLGAAQVGEKIVKIPLDQIVPDPNQPRRTFDQKDIDELAESIDAVGQTTPAEVRLIKDGTKPYMLIAGEKRWRACKIAKTKTLDCIVRELTDEEILMRQSIENNKRAGLVVKDAVANCVRLVEAYGATKAAFAVKGGKPMVSKMNAIGTLPITMTLLESEVCEDIETLYRVVRLHKKDSAAAEKLATRWQAKGDDGQVSQRAEVDRLLNLLDGKDEQAESVRASRVMGKVDTLLTNPPPASKKGEADTPKGGAGTSSANHGSGSGSAKPASPAAPSASAGGGAAGRAAQGAAPSKTGGGGQAGGKREEPGVAVDSADITGNVVTLHTADGDFRFDRASLNRALGLDS